MNAEELNQLLAENPKAEIVLVVAGRPLPLEREHVTKGVHAWFITIEPPVTETRFVTN